MSSCQADSSRPAKLSLPPPLRPDAATCLECRLLSQQVPSSASPLEAALTAELEFYAEKTREWQTRMAAKVDRCLTNLRKKAFIFFRKNYDVG